MAQAPAKAPRMPEMPNGIAVRKRTRPALQCGTAPTAEVTPTTASEVAVARCASCPMMKTRMGTVRIDPPPPIIPSEIPIKVPSKTASMVPSFYRATGRRCVFQAIMPPCKLLTCSKPAWVSAPTVSRTAIAAATDHDEFLRPIEPPDMLPKLSERDVNRAWDVSLTPFVRLAYVDNHGAGR